MTGLVSLAITHFAVGGALTAIAALYLLPPLRYARTLVLLGGVWAMIPDIHWVTPVFAAELKALHSSVFGNVFWFHETLDVIDPTDSREAGALALAVFLIAVSLGDRWSYTTRERADDDIATGWPIEPIRSLSILTRLAGGLGILLGVIYIIVGIVEPGVGSLRGLYLGLGATLTGIGLIGVGGKLGVHAWVQRRTPRSVRLLTWSALSTGTGLLGGTLLVTPLRGGIHAESIVFAGLGSVLLVLALLVAQLRLRTKT